MSSAWSEPGNWSPAGVPSSADTLTFPSSGASMNNDLPAGTAVGPLSFSGGTITLTGNALTLMGDVTFSGPAESHLNCGVNLKLGSSISIGNASSSNYSGTIDVNGKTLSITAFNTALGALNGSGTINIDGSALTISNGGSFTGTINGVFDLGGSMPGANVAQVWTAPTYSYPLSGTGTVGNVSVSAVSPGRRVPCCND